MPIKNELMNSLNFSSIEYLYVPSVVPKLIKLKSNFSNVIKRKLVFLKYQRFPIYIYTQATKTDHFYPKL